MAHITDRNTLYYEFQMFRGDSFSEPIPFSTQVVGADLTGSKLYVHIKRTPYDKEPIYQMEATYSGTASTGVFMLEIPEADSKLLPFGEFVFDGHIQVGTIHRTIIEGPFTIHPDVSVLP